LPTRPLRAERRVRRPRRRPLPPREARCPDGACGSGTCRARAAGA
jgi:hypothetical protein